MNLTQAEKFRQQKISEGHKSDGCTFAPDIGASCCEMHDFLRRFRPENITAKEADKLLRECLQKKGHPILAWVYYLASRFAHLIGWYK